MSQCPTYVQAIQCPVATGSTERSFRPMSTAWRDRQRTPYRSLFYLPPISFILYNDDSTSIRPQFDHATTIWRPSLYIFITVMVAENKKSKRLNK